MTTRGTLFIIAPVQRIVTAAEMREIDRLTAEQFAIPSLLLMEGAAAAAARHVAAHLSHDLTHKTICVFCGPGNNGGDGAALARVLWTLGARVSVLLLGRVEATKGDARFNFEIVRRIASSADAPTESTPGIFFTECESADRWEQVASSTGADADVLVDALFGTGLKRPLEGIFRRAVEHLSLVRDERENSGGARPLVVSLDLPSGLDADSATPAGVAVRADLTVTFTAPKPANVLPPAAHFNGQLHVAHIGSPTSIVEAAPSRLFLTEASDARRWLWQTRYAPGSYKNTHGHALVVAGSRRMTGAAILCAEAAIGSGAGLVTVAVPASAMDAVAARLMPELMTAPLPETEEGAASAEAAEEVLRLAGRATVVAAGPGLTSNDERTRRFVRALVERRTTPLVLDADALNALAPWPPELRGRHDAPLVLTPHEGEMRRLLGANEEAGGGADDLARRLRDDRVGAAREFATAHQLILVLKGARTLVAAPDGRVFVNPTGSAGLGTAGSGDTLTGLITGFLAQAFAALKGEADALAATLAAVYVGGLAGDFAARARGVRTMVASDIRAHVGDAVRALDPRGEQP